MYGRLVDTLTSHNFPLELVGRANPILEAKSKLDNLNVVKKYLGAKKQVVASNKKGGALLASCCFVQNSNKASVIISNNGRITYFYT
jgi:hypothetical protein